MGTPWNTSEHMQSAQGVPLKPAEIREKSGMEHLEHLEHREKDRGEVVGAIGTLHGVNAHG
jgi:hypothetical protein